MQARKAKIFFSFFVQEMIPHLTITETEKEGQQAREKADQWAAVLTVLPLQCHLNILFGWLCLSRMQVFSAPNTKVFKGFKGDSNT